MATSEKALQSGPFGRQDPSLPQVFGRYLLVQRLSRGGMGEIFLAKHGLAGFEKLAVIKKVLPHLAADASFISRFVDEAQVAIKLAHVNIAQVFEVGRVGDEYFLALEYVEGRDLRRTLALLGHKKQRLPVDLALFIGRELANGLAYAHRRTSQDGASLNLVHCDISPPNVLVSFEGETKVIDFGIAKSALRGTATDPKMGFGKFGYMAPEQLIRGGLVDYRTDIYAAGVVLFELLTGQRLYEVGPEPDYRALAKKVARGEHTMPSQVDSALAPYDDLVATALRPKPEDRYQSAAEFRDAIQQALVMVNPTISTDQLGAFMRELFSEEMTAQRELHDRVASAHLADFQDALNTQTISTISFAVAQLPAPPELPRPHRSGQLPSPRGKLSGQHAIVRPSPALDTVAPPTSSMSPDDLAALGGLADGTQQRELEREQTARRRTWWVVGGAAVTILIAVTVVWATRGDSDPKRDNIAAATGSDHPTAITVVPIDETPRVDPPKTDIKPPPPIQPPPLQPPTTDKHPPRKPPRGTTVHPPKPPDQAKPEVTASQVESEFRRAQRLYTGFKDKYGARLEGDYTQLMTALQYEKTPAEKLRKIEAFISKLHD